MNMEPSPFDWTENPTLLSRAELRGLDKIFGKDCQLLIVVGDGETLRMALRDFCKHDFEDLKDYITKAQETWLDDDHEPNEH
ncbi:MAG: hypothetical protein KGJ90_02230 [Patescibacteria group bacterium]|nr:hypothetical protein [Patescibacteria group bacterium]